MVMMIDELPEEKEGEVVVCRRIEIEDAFRAILAAECVGTQRQTSSAEITCQAETLTAKLVDLINYGRSKS